VNARLLAAVFLIAVSPALADPPERTVTMSGRAEVTAAPDRAQISAGVVSEAKTAAAAFAANARTMNTVFAELKKAGIAERNIQTSDLSVAPVYQNVAQKWGPSQRRIVGYRATNLVSVTIDKIDRIGATVDALVGAGANQVNDIAFSIRDSAALLAKARKAAAKDAILRAETYAEAAGVKLGPILSIREDASSPIRPMRRAMMYGMAEAANSAPAPIAGGEESLSASVTIVWQIQ
jgi:uncharacterized protein YggE